MGAMNGAAAVVVVVAVLICVGSRLRKKSIFGLASDKLMFLVFARTGLTLSSKVGYSRRCSGNAKWRFDDCSVFERKKGENGELTII